MGTVSINSITINNASGSYGFGPFHRNTSITSVDLGYAPWTNNSMYSAFKNCKNLSSVMHINQNITDMKSTFYNCPSLVNAPVIPNSVTNMLQTFDRCNNLVNAPVIPNSVTNMVLTFNGCSSLVNAPIIPNSVTNMCEAFSNCYSLVNAPEISTNVNDISYAFRYCNNLVNAPVIPNSVTNMYETFINCINLNGNIYIQSLNIKSSNRCFESTSNQKNVYIPYNESLGIYTNTYNAFNTAGYKPSTTQNGVTIKENPYFETYNNFWWDSYYNIIYKYLGSSSDIVVPNIINGHNISGLYLDSFNTPNTITSINFDNVIVFGNMSNKFYGCTQLQSITNLNTNSNISDISYTFFNCTSLVNAPIIPNSVTAMAGTFAQCNNLVNAPSIIPNGVNYIGWLFINCYSLVNAPIIPESVKSMYSTFDGCSSLTGNIFIKSNQIDNAIYCFSGSLTKNVYIPFTYMNGEYTKTYNSFINAGFKTDGSSRGVYLMNYTELYN